MTLIEIARIYTDLVDLDNQIPDAEHTSKEEVGSLRSKYHQILMDKMTEEGIEYADRFDAMNKAFELIHAQQGGAADAATHRRRESCIDHWLPGQLGATASATPSVNTASFVSSEGKTVAGFSRLSLGSACCFVNEAGAMPAPISGELA